MERALGARTDYISQRPLSGRGGRCARKAPRGRGSCPPSVWTPACLGVHSASGARPPEVKGPRGRRSESVASSPGTDAIQSGPRGFDVAPSLGWLATRGAAVTVWPGPGGRRGQYLGGCRPAPPGPAYHTFHIPVRKGGEIASPASRGGWFPRGMGVGRRVPGTEEPLQSSSLTLAGPRGPRASPSPAGPSWPTSVNLCARTRPARAGAGGEAVTWPGFGPSFQRSRTLV